MNGPLLFASAKESRKATFAAVIASSLFFFLYRDQPALSENMVPLTLVLGITALLPLSALQTRPARLLLTLILGLSAGFWAFYLGFLLRANYENMPQAGGQSASLGAVWSVLGELVTAWLFAGAIYMHAVLARHIGRMPS